MPPKTYKSGNATLYLPNLNDDTYMRRNPVFLNEGDRITFHQLMRPGHSVIHEGGAISWVEDDPFKTPTIDRSNEGDSKMAEAIRKAFEPFKQKVEESGKPIEEVLDEEIKKALAERDKPKQYEEVIPL